MVIDLKQKTEQRKLFCFLFSDDLMGLASKGRLKLLYLPVKHSRSRLLAVAVDFVEVHVAADLVALFVDDADVGLVFFNGRDFTQFGTNRRQFCRAEVNEYSCILYGSGLRYDMLVASKIWACYLISSIILFPC